MSIQTRPTVGLVVKKCGMTRIYQEDGSAIPVTVLAVESNRVTQVKTQKNDGYDAIQVTAGLAKQSRLTKPLVGHYAKAGVEPGKGLWEFRTPGEPTFEVGAVLDTSIFTVGQYVDVQGVTIGKGFAGTIKRHHFASQDASHGNSVSHRTPGSIGQRQTPGRVFKGKKMCGHLGNKVRSILSQKIVQIDSGRQLIFVKGAVPGSDNAYVIIRPAIKR